MFCGVHEWLLKQKQTTSALAAGRKRTGPKAFIDPSSSRTDSDRYCRKSRSQPSTHFKYRNRNYEPDSAGTARFSASVRYEPGGVFLWASSNQPNTATAGVPQQASGSFAKRHDISNRHKGPRFFHDIHAVDADRGRTTNRFACKRGGHAHNLRRKTQ